MSASADPPPRINRYLADCGFGSRRSCETIVAEGRVSINGEICTTLGTRVQRGDKVTVDNKPAKPAEDDITILLNKPAGVLCTRSDPQGRETIFDLLPGYLRKRRDLHYAGRLDLDSEGLILLTTDGDLSQRLAHPKGKVQKEYVVNLVEPFKESDSKALLAGVKIEGSSRPARAVGVDKVSKRTVAITLEQGMKRQVRLMLAAVGHRVKRLIRVRIGGLVDPNLKRGAWRQLGRKDLSALLHPDPENAGDRAFRA